MEKWKPVKGFENRYKISNKGRVESLYQNKIMKSYINNSGYECIDFQVNNKVTKNTVHRLVALHFCVGYEEGLHVNHKDGDRLNNNSNNLEWVTVQENIDDMIERGTLDVRTAQRVAWESNKKPVAMLDDDGVILQTFPSMKEASEITGANQFKIGVVCSGQRKRTGGYRWKLIDRSMI